VFAVTRIKENDKKHCKQTCQSCEPKHIVM